MTTSTVAADLTESLAEPSSALVVEDNDLFRDSIMNELEQLGIKPVAVTTGRDAIEVYQKRLLTWSPSRQHRCPFDLVFVDNRLPDYVGLDVIKTIRSLYEGQFVILMTGYDVPYDPALGVLGLWFKSSRPMNRDLKRICNLMEIPIEPSTPL